MIAFKDFRLLQILWLRWKASARNAYEIPGICASSAGLSVFCKQFVSHEVVHLIERKHFCVKAFFKQAPIIFNS